MKLSALLRFVGRLWRPVPVARRADAEGSPPTRVDLSPQTMHRLARLLAAMPRVQREALRLHFRRRWALGQIARHLGLTPLHTAGLIWGGARILDREFPPADPNPPGT